MTTLQVITTFPENRWDVYAKRMLQSHIDYWPDDVKITAYYEGTKPNLQHEKIEYIGDLIIDAFNHEGNDVSKVFIKENEDLPDEYTINKVSERIYNILN